MMRNIERTATHFLPPSSIIDRRLLSITATVLQEIEMGLIDDRNLGPFSPIDKMSVVVHARVGSGGTNVRVH